MFNLKGIAKYFIDNSSIADKDLEKGTFEYKSQTQTLFENNSNINHYLFKSVIIDTNDKYEKVSNIV